MGLEGGLQRAVLGLHGGERFLADLRHQRPRLPGGSFFASAYPGSAFTRTEPASAFSRQALETRRPADKRFSIVVRCAGMARKGQDTIRRLHLFRACGHSS